MTLSLGLDVGTTKTAAVAVNDGGRIVRRISRVHDASLSQQNPLLAEQDPARHLDAVHQVLRELANELPGVPRCLGITGQMHGVMLSDRRLEPLSPLITWQDRRLLLPGGGQPTEYDRLRERLADVDDGPSGCTMVPGFGGLTLGHLLLSDRLPRTADRASVLADWIAARLTARPVVTDRSHAGSLGIFNFCSDEWDPATLEALEIPRHILPEVCDSGEEIGFLTPESAAATGLPAGLPVACPTGDNAAAILGSTWGTDHFLQINIGTGGQIAWPLAEFARLPGLETRYLPPRRFMAVGAGVSGGTSYEWLARTVQTLLADFGHEREIHEVFDVLNDAAAAATADADGLRCIPTIRGTRRHPDQRGSVLNINPANLTLPNLARATLVGIVDGLEQFLDFPGSPDPASFPLRIGTGNALRRNPLLAEIIESRFGGAFLTPSQFEEAAFGAALLAAMHAGIWSEAPSIILEPLMPGQKS